MNQFNFTPEEQEFYLSRKKSYIPKPKAPRKEREDKGTKRAKYSSSLPKKYKSYLMRANKKGLPFTLTVEEFEGICARPCSYCGQEDGGVDRIESSKGYTISNSQPCCTQCNMMKYIYSEKKFLDKITEICEYRSISK